MTQEVPRQRLQRILDPRNVNVGSWGEHLPVVTDSTLRTAELRRRLRRRMRRLPADLWRRLGLALAEIVPEDLIPDPCLEIALVHPDGARESLELRAPTTVIGRDVACDVRLRSPAVAARQAELRLSPDSIWLLALAPGITVDGVPLESDRPLSLAAGSVIDLPPFRLVIGSLRSAVGDDAEPARAAVAPRGAVPLLADEALASLAPGAVWLRLGYGDWQGFTSVPSSWANFAARVLGLPPGRADAQHDDVDCALLSFVLRRAAKRLEELTGHAVQVAGPFSAEQTELFLERGLAERLLATAQLGVELGGTRHESVAVWPEPNHAAGPPALHLVFAPVMVEAGFTVLAACDLPRLAPGDVVLPDRWYPGDWPISPEAPEDPAAGERTVKLRLDGTRHTWTAEARLSLDEDGRFQLETATPWLADDSDTSDIPPQEGDAMHDEDNLEEAALSTAPTDGPPLGDDLDVVLGFELDRFTVPLGELRNWREGEAMRLERGPDDPIRLMLHQPGGTRLLGHGRVVMLDDQLGVVVDSWASANAETTESPSRADIPAADSAVESEAQDA